MGRLSIPVGEHRKIRRSAGVRAGARKVGAQIAAAAGGIADDPNGYGVEETLGSDRTRVNVWAKTAKAERAEAKSAPLLQAMTKAKP